jgi:toxin ParE1/3/4
VAGYKLSTHIAAQGEALDAAKWYVERSELAAVRFVRELNSKISGILSEPERWPMFEAGARRALLNDFPYSVIYRIKGDVVEIVAIMHQRRKPGYWADR